MALFRFLPKLRITVIQNDSNIAQRMSSLSEGGIMSHPSLSADVSLCFRPSSLIYNTSRMGKSERFSKKFEKNQKGPICAGQIDPF